MIIQLTSSMTITVNSFADLMAALIQYPLDNSTIVNAVINDKDFFKIVTRMSEIEQLAEKINDAEVHDDLFVKIATDRAVFKTFFKMPPDLVIGFRAFSTLSDIMQMYAYFVCNILGDDVTRESINDLGTSVFKERSGTEFINVGDLVANRKSIFINKEHFINAVYFTNTAIAMSYGDQRKIKLIVFCFWFYTMFYTICDNNAKAFQEVVNIFKKCSFINANNTQNTNYFSVPSTVMLRFIHDICNWIDRIDHKFCQFLASFYHDLRLSIPTINTDERYKDIREVPNMMSLIQRRSSALSIAQLLNLFRIKIAVNNTIGNNALLIFLNHIKNNNPKLLESSTSDISFLMAHLLSIDIDSAKNPFDSDSEAYQQAIVYLNENKNMLFQLLHEELLYKNVITLSDYAIAIAMFPNRAVEMFRLILCDNLIEASQQLKSFGFIHLSYNEQLFSEFIEKCYTLLSLYVSRHRILDTTSAVYLYQMLFLCEISTYLLNNQVKQIEGFPQKVNKILKEKFSFMNPKNVAQLRNELADSIESVKLTCNLGDTELVKSIDKVILVLNNRKMGALSVIPNKLFSDFIISGVATKQSPAENEEPLKNHNIVFQGFNILVQEIAVQGNGLCLAEAVDIENPRMILQNILNELQQSLLNENHPLILKLVDALLNDLRIGQLDQDSNWFASIPDDTGGLIVDRVNALLAACQEQDAITLSENSGPELALKNYLKNQKILQYYIQYLLHKNYYNTIIATLLLNYPTFPQPPIVIGNVRPQPNGELKLELPDNVSLIEDDKINPHIKFVIFRDNSQHQLLSHYNRLKVLNIKPIIENFPRINK